MTVLVTGGAGYIGSHMVNMLCAGGYSVVVIDNLTTGHRDAVGSCDLIIGDVGDMELVDRILSEYDIKTVMHFAASAEVAESKQNPMKYYSNNVANTINLLEAMIARNVRKLIFSSTCAVYGSADVSAINECHPVAPINPYGHSKLTIDRILDDLWIAGEMSSISLRYFNAGGADWSLGLGERHDPETHVIPLALRAAAALSPSFFVYGNDYPTRDGSCVRDFVHVLDLCSAHKLALELLNNNECRETYNLGNDGEGTSVLEILQVVAKVTGLRVPFQIRDRRPGDPARLIADSSKARSELGWEPQFNSIEEIIRSAWLFENQLKSGSIRFK